MMNKEIIKTDQAPLPIGPYNQAVKVNGFVYTSGQIPLDLKTGQVCAGGIKEQAGLVLRYIKAIVEAAGSSVERIVKVTVYLKDMNDFALVNGLYAEMFEAADAPARVAVEVARLPKDVLIEMDAVAVV